MDPKQERALQDGSASEDDQPRDDRSRRRTAAVPDARVNMESATPVERLAREIGAEPVPEMGRARDRHRNADPAEAEDLRSEAAPSADKTADEEVPVDPSEARRTLKARREHSKGDGNFPRVEPGPELVDERLEDRRPRDLPKARDDRSAPKGNVTIGQEDRDRAKRKPKVAPGAKRTRAGRTPTGTKENVAKRPSSARLKARPKATRPAVRSKRTRNAMRATPRRSATPKRRRSRGA